MTRTHLLLAVLLAFGAGTPAFAQDQEYRDSNVTITDHPGNSISPNYSVDFAAMDANGDGVVVRSEARGNADLMREFHVVDLDHDGRLTRAEMKDWIDPIDIAASER